jgi:hypothetical protein
MEGAAADRGTDVGLGEQVEHSRVMKEVAQDMLVVPLEEEECKETPRKQIVEQGMTLPVA